MECTSGLGRQKSVWAIKANCGNPQIWESGADCVFKLSFKATQIEMNEL